MPQLPTDAWHEVGEFEIEDLSGKTTIVPVSVARDPSGCLFIKVADHEAGVERLETPDQLVGYFANYGTPYLIDLRNALSGMDGFEEVCRLTELALEARR